MFQIIIHHFHLSGRVSIANLAHCPGSGEPRSTCRGAHCGWSLSTIRWDLSRENLLESAGKTGFLPWDTGLSSRFSLIHEYSGPARKSSTIFNRRRINLQLLPYHQLGWVAGRKMILQIKILYNSIGVSSFSQRHLLESKNICWKVSIIPIPFAGKWKQHIPIQRR